MKSLNRFPSVTVLVIGDLVADHYLFGRTERVSREAPVLIVRHEREEVKLGGGANAAANVRALGGAVHVVGVVGADPMGKTLRGLLREAGMTPHLVPGPFTETKTRVLAGGVSTTRQQMLRIDRGAVGVLPPKTRAALARAVERAAKEADVVLVSDYGAGVVCDEVKQVLRKLAASGQPVCVDSRYALSTFSGMTLCKPNEPELSLLVGESVEGDEALSRAARRARERLGCSMLLVTRGRRGLALATGDGVELVPRYGLEDAVDVTGAGDTVLATMGLALGAGASPLEAARLANVAGALVVQKPGTATVSAGELRSAWGAWG